MLKIFFYHSIKKFYHNILAGLVPRRNSFKRVPLAESKIRINVPFSDAEAIKDAKNKFKNFNI